MYTTRLCFSLKVYFLVFIKILTMVVLTLAWILVCNFLLARGW